MTRRAWTVFLELMSHPMLRFWPMVNAIWRRRGWKCRVQEAPGEREPVIGGNYRDRRDLGCVRGDSAAAWRSRRSCDGRVDELTAKLGGNLPVDLQDLCPAFGSWPTRSRWLRDQEV